MICKMACQDILSEVLELDSIQLILPKILMQQCTFCLYASLLLYVKVHVKIQQILFCLKKILKTEVFHYYLDNTRHSLSKKWHL